MLVENVLIDNLVVVGEDSGKFANRVNNYSFSYIEKVTPSAFPYRKSFHCEDGSFLQWTDEHNVKPIRFDFNPSKCDIEGAEKVLSTMKYPKV
ncbi:hypothetical protein, partial [Halobacillus campisalis]